MLDPIRLPRTGLIVLRQEKTKLSGAAELREVGVSRPPAAGVDHDQAQGASDGGVGAKPLPHHVVAGVDAKRLQVGTAHHDQRRGGMRGGLNPAEIEAGFEHRFDGGEQDRHIGRQTAGHHGVDGAHASGGLGPARRHHADYFFGGAIRCARQHGLHQLIGRRNDGKAVGPVLLVEEVNGFLPAGGFDLVRDDGFVEVGCHVRSFLNPVRCRSCLPGTPRQLPLSRCRHRPARGRGSR